MPELTQAADGLHPAKDLFHEFPFPLTHVVARVPRRPVSMATENCTLLGRTSRAVMGRGNATVPE